MIAEGELDDRRLELSRVRDVQGLVCGADDVVCQGDRNEEDAQRESIAGTGQHDGVLQPKQGPRAPSGTEIPAEAEVEVQLLPHLLNYNEIHVAGIWRLIFILRIIV
jgi:hypothetical protein